VVRLAKNFDTLDTAQAEVLFLIAGSLSSFWDLLFRATRLYKGTWVQYVEGVAGLLKSQEGGISTRAQASDLWHIFEVSLLVKNSPEEVRSVVRRAGEDLAKKLQSETDPFLYLEECNARACVAVRELLDKLGVEDRGIEVVPLNILLDQEGKAPVAATSSLEREINWTLDRRPRSLFAAVAAQSVLEHEYLSHLAPRSDALTPLVREEWLMALLLFDIRDRNANDAAFSAVYYLWRNLNALGEVTRPELSLAAAKMEYAHYDLYIRFNREILNLPSDKAAAARLDEVVDYIGNASEDDLRRLFTGPTGTLFNMWKEVQRFRGLRGYE
jgi:hypothetical protein